jgi:hypothetical protein
MFKVVVSNLSLFFKSDFIVLEQYFFDVLLFLTVNLILFIFIGLDSFTWTGVSITVNCSI